MFRSLILARLLTGFCLLALGASGCHRAAPPDPEKVALDALMSEYEPKEQKFDDKGRVTSIDLNGAHVDDEAMEQVSQFKMLKSLSINSSAVTDAGIVKLRDLKRLTSLGMTDCRVTDRGLAQMQKMPSLRYVWVTTNNGLTQTGVEGLKKAIPGINVYVMNAPKKTPPKTDETPK